MLLKVATEASAATATIPRAVVLMGEVGMTKPSAKASGRCSRSASSVAALAAGAAGLSLLLRPRLRWGVLLVVIFSCVMLRRSAMVLVRSLKIDAYYDDAR